MAGSCCFFLSTPDGSLMIPAVLDQDEGSMDMNGRPLISDLICTDRPATPRAHQLEEDRQFIVDMPHARWTTRKTERGAATRPAVFPLPVSSGRWVGPPRALDIPRRWIPCLQSKLRAVSCWSEAGWELTGRRLFSVVLIACHHENHPREHPMLVN